MNISCLSVYANPIETIHFIIHLLLYIKNPISYVHHIIQNVRKLYYRKIYCKQRNQQPLLIEVRDILIKKVENGFVLFLHQFI